MNLTACRSFFLLTILVIGGLFSPLAHAQLRPGATAPDFTTQASQGGKEFSYHLKKALSKGPVVLYFYPAAFTKGCTIEAHEFAEATPQYHALGASIIGISMDPIATLHRFSMSECRSAFPVAADPTGTITTAYHAQAAQSKHSNRTSYVISPDDTIAMTYTNDSPDEHVQRTLTAVKNLLSHH